MQYQACKQGSASQSWDLTVLLAGFSYSFYENLQEQTQHEYKMVHWAPGGLPVCSATALRPREAAASTGRLSLGLYKTSC